MAWLVIGYEGWQELKYHIAYFKYHIHKFDLVNRIYFCCEFS